MNPAEFPYSGPRAAFASITGSPLWGLSIDAVIETYRQRGWTYEGGSRIETPYGLGPEVHFFQVGLSVSERARHEQAPQRPFIWIPSYGDQIGEESISQTTLQRVFWILWKAGVEVLLVGGNSGVCDARPLSDTEAIHPGDVVLPWSYRTHSHHRGLPGTPYASVWPHHNLLLDAPFCPALAEQFTPLLQPYLERGIVRRIHTPQTVRAALVHVETITFETDFDILMWRAIVKVISDLEPDRPPVATLHGDCINPLLARFLGIHLLYYHLVCNHAQGLGGAEDIHETISGLFLHSYPAMTLDLEATVVERFAIPQDSACLCRRSLKPNPPIFVEAMSGHRPFPISPSPLPVQ